MRTPFHIELRQILHSIRLVAESSFQWRDEPVVNASRLPPVVLASGAGNHPLPEDALTRALQAILYQRCYCHAHDAQLPTPTGAMAPTDEFLSQLSQANAGRDRWDGGWQTYLACPDGVLFVTKGDRQLRIPPGDYVMEAVTFRSATVGTRVTVRAPRESHAVQAGFYFMFGETMGDVWDEHHTVRYYFNPGSAGAPELIRQLTSGLNRFQVPFRMKALSHPGAYTRADAVVLYLARRFHAIACRLIAALPDPLASCLGPRIPLFTRRVRDGVGLAEDPGNGESFGMQRCRLVAEGVVEAGRAGRQDLASRVRAVRKRFQAAGLDLDRPHLRGGLLDLTETESQA